MIKATKGSGLPPPTARELHRVHERIDADFGDEFYLLARLAMALTSTSSAIVALETGGRYQALHQDFNEPPRGAGRYPDDPLSDRLLSARESFLTGDAGADPGLRSTWEVRRLGVHSLAVIPLRRARGESLGVLLLMDNALHRFSATDVRVLERMAAVCIDRVEARLVATTEGQLEPSPEPLPEPNSDLAVAAPPRPLSSEGRFRSLLDASPGPFFMVRGAEVVYANRAAIALCGGERLDDVVGQPMGRFLEGPLLKRVRESILGANPPPPTHVESLQRLDGKIVYTEVEARPYVHDGRPIVLLSVHDVSRRYQDAVQLGRLEDQQRLLLEAMPAFAWTCNLAHQITSKTTARQGLPHPVREGTADTIACIFDQDDPRSPALQAHAGALAGHPTGYRQRWRGLIFDVRVEPLIGGDGGVVGCIAVAVDVTRQAQQELADGQRLHREALERVAGGVAHELNNVLSAILSRASALAETVPPDGGSRDDFDAIVAAARQGSAIVNNLLGFAGSRVSRRVKVDVGTLLEEIAARAVRQAPPTVEVRVSVAEDIPEIVGDRLQLAEGLWQLCLNGLAAMPRGGCLGIEAIAERVEADSSDYPRLAQGSYARLRVTDTGEGMSDEVQAHAVEPFYSTRSLGQGVGLGLSMASGVARSHNGELSFASVSGRGTTVTIMIPELVRARSATASPTGPGAASPGGPRSPTLASGSAGTALIIDDDDMVREALGVIMKHLSYRVVEAGDGPEALQLFARTPEAFAVVLLDMQMPVMEGDEVLRRLMKINPSVPVLISSGYDKGRISPDLFMVGQVGYLAKPFGVADLRRALALLLAPTP